MTNVGGATNTQEAQSRNTMNICTKYGFDILIISGSYGGQAPHRWAKYHKVILTHARVSWIEKFSH